MGTEARPSLCQARNCARRLRTALGARLPPNPGGPLFGLARSLPNPGTWEEPGRVTPPLWRTWISEQGFGAAGTESAPSGPMVSVSRSTFGALPSGAGTVEKFQLQSDQLRLDVLSWGCTISALEVKDRQGRAADVVLGFGDLEGGQSARSARGLGGASRRRAWVLGISPEPKGK